MNDQPVPFPRIHTDEYFRFFEKTIKSTIESVPGLADLFAAFEAATGWTLSYHELPQAGNGAIGKRKKRALLKIDDMSEKLPPGKSAVSRAHCDQVISAIDIILNHLQETRAELRDRAAELATAIPVVRRSDAPNLADLLESLLRSAAQLVNASAAAIYLLDDATSELHLRVSVGLPAARLNQPARSLKHAAGDLEALVGHAVVVNDAAAVEHWNIPENFSSAVCLPIATATVPLGTMWLFANELRQINADDTNILEIIAGRIAAELEREAILRNSQEINDFCFDLARLVSKLQLANGARPAPTDPSGLTPLTDKEDDDLQLDAREPAVADDPEAIDAEWESGQIATLPIFSERDWANALRWQKRTEPVMMPMLDGWQIGGRRKSSHSLCCAFHGWQVLPDSRIAMFLGDSGGENIAAALTAASLRMAIKSLANQALCPHIILERVNEILWYDGMGDQFISLFCGMIDPETGNLEYCAAGNLGAIVFESYVDRNLIPGSEPLGTDIDAVFQSQRHLVLPGQSLFVYNDGLRQLCPTEMMDCEDEGLCEILNLAGPGDLSALNEWLEGRYANRTIMRRDPADAAFTLVKRLHS